MSNSSHCAGRTLIFITRKTCSGPQFITQQFESNLDVIKPVLTENGQKLVIFYDLLRVSSDSLVEIDHSGPH